MPPLKKCSNSGERYPAKSYVHQNVSLATWSMMKTAMVMCGTGAYTVFKKTYKNYQSGGGLIPAFGWSETVTRPMEV